MILVSKKDQNFKFMQGEVPDIYWRHVYPVKKISLRSLMMLCSTRTFNSQVPIQGPFPIQGPIPTQGPFPIQGPIPTQGPFPPEVENEKYIEKI